jgi:hypothetical protein
LHLQNLPMTWDDVFAWCCTWWNTDAVLWVEHAFKTVVLDCCVSRPFPVAFIVRILTCGNISFDTLLMVCWVWMCAAKPSKNQKLP